MIAALFAVPLAGIVVMIAWRIRQADQRVAAILRDEFGGDR